MLFYLCLPAESEAGLKPDTLPIACDPSSGFRGVAFSPDSYELLLTDSSTSRIILLSFREEGDIREVPLPKNLTEPEAEPENAAYAYGRFWVKVMIDKMIAKLFWLDTDSYSLHEVSIDDPGAPEKLPMIGSPFVLSHRDWLVLYNPFWQRLYWLDQDCHVCKKTVIPKSTHV